MNETYQRRKRAYEAVYNYVHSLITNGHDVPENIKEAMHDLHPQRHVGRVKSFIDALLAKGVDNTVTAQEIFEQHGMDRTSVCGAIRAYNKKVPPENTLFVECNRRENTYTLLQIGGEAPDNPRLILPGKPRTVKAEPLNKKKRPLNVK